MKVQSAVNPEPVEILGDKVLVRSNITNELNEEGNMIYEYDEERYSKDEYIKKLDNENKTMQKAIDDLIFGGAL